MRSRRGRPFSATIRDTGVFLTASGILTAVFFVWSQLWLTEPGAGYWTTNIGLTWNYASVVITLAAFAIAAGNSLRQSDRRDVPWPAVALLASAVLMALMEVLLSLATVIAKSVSRTPISSPISIKWLGLDACHAILWYLGTAALAGLIPVAALLLWQPVMKKIGLSI